MSSLAAVPWATTVFSSRFTWTQVTPEMDLRALTTLFSHFPQVIPFTPNSLVTSFVSLKAPTYVHCLSLSGVSPGIR
eukprot:CAMPEP_0173433254 /NCGR_PEP_ID=MMETSP1357-20121228/10771_1 /TAXON_ID=77926 /ORGANISM="Hemiselmis rufescens, Strain PCC563" /LENGTH=76 /DNA_ID=CAMNT_0014397945 /DNA_START=203 /DNA_END=429 /DNA_ORIENTATION=+